MLKWASVDIIRWHELHVGDEILWFGDACPVESISASDKKIEWAEIMFEGKKMYIDREPIFYRIKNKRK